jgi:hypothetical protein
MKYWQLKEALATVLLILGFQLLAIAQEEKEKAEQEFELELEGEYSYFYEEAAFQGQEEHYPSLAIKPEYSRVWDKGSQRIEATAFFRFDRDNKRTHGDIRELYYQRVKNFWELSIGFKKVYWGVAESNHLVDVINQTDQVESFDGEAKLGQPMVQMSLVTNDIGTFYFFLLPYHRRRTFPGSKGRLRFAEVIDAKDISYEHDWEEWNQDVAIRWSHFIGIADIGLSYFYGNGREPLFRFSPNGDLAAFYPLMHQIGLDLQLTHNAFLWKLESIYRETKYQDFLALVAGLEYTFSNIDGNGLDIGVLGEYLYDERDELALSALQNDLFLGCRLALNDVHSSAILFGSIIDLEKDTRIVSVEASRRLSDSWTGALEGRFFTSVAQEELIFSNFSQDSFLRLKLSKFF